VKQDTKMESILERVFGVFCGVFTWVYLQNTGFLGICSSVSVSIWLFRRFALWTWNLQTTAKTDIQ